MGIGGEDHALGVGAKPAGPRGDSEMVQTFDRLTPSELAEFATRYEVNPATGCWEWSSWTHPRGWAYFHFANKRGAAHRIAYREFVGPLEPGLTIHHTCHVRHCVNPDHLEQVTRQENSADTSRRGTPNCPHGHKYTPENTRSRQRPTRWGGVTTQRSCRTCENEGNRARRARNR